MQQATPPSACATAHNFGPCTLLAAHHQPAWGCGLHSSAYAARGRCSVTCGHSEGRHCRLAQHWERLLTVGVVGASQLTVRGFSATGGCFCQLPSRIGRERPFPQFFRVFPHCSGLPVHAFCDLMRSLLWVLRRDQQPYTGAAMSAFQKSIRGTTTVLHDHICKVGRMTLLCYLSE